MRPRGPGNEDGDVHELVPSLKLKYSIHIFCISCPYTNQLLVIIQELNLHSFASQVATN